MTDSVCSSEMYWGRGSALLTSRLLMFSFQPASSTSTSQHQFGLSTRTALQCSSPQFAPPSRCLATTSCRSSLHSSSCLRQRCSRGEPWKGELAAWICTELLKLLALRRALPDQSLYLCLVYSCITVDLQWMNSAHCYVVLLTVHFTIVHWVLGQLRDMQQYP